MTFFTNAFTEKKEQENAASRALQAQIFPPWQELGPLPYAQGFLGR